MITVLRWAILSVLFSAGVSAETLPPTVAPKTAAANVDVKATKTTISGQSAALTFPPGSGSFRIALAQGKKSLEVFSYQPVGADATTPIVIVMTGVDRNAATYRNDWMPVADQYHLRVIVPRFSEQDFPGAAGYNLGNLVDAKTHRKLPASQWAFSVVDALLKKKQKQGITNKKQ